MLARVGEHQVGERERDAVDAPDRAGLPAAGDQRPRSPANVSHSETSGSNTSRARRKAASARPNGTSKWPG